MLYQLSKPLTGVVDPLIIAQPQLDHTILQSDVFEKLSQRSQLPETTAVRAGEKV